MKIFHTPLRWGRFLKWIGVLLTLSFSTMLSWGPSWGAFAQDQKQVEPTQVPASLMSPIERAEKDGTALHISLKELTKLALQNNLDIAISDTNEAMYQQKVIQNYGFYDPTITLTLQDGRSKSANTNITNRSATGFNQRDNALWNFSMVKNLPTGGGITATFNSSRSDTNQLATLFTPQFQSSASVQFTQPLRRNFRTDQTRGTIKLANLDLKTNDSKFKQSVTTTIASIQNLYWDLVYAIRNYNILRESMELAKITVAQNKAKVEIGTLASITVTEALATQATREINLIQAKATIQSTENSLRNMISNDRNADIWHQTIVPADSPDFNAYTVELDEAIETALKNRPELEQYDLQLQQNDITYQIQKNMKKWQFDLVGSFGANGTAGPQSYSSSGVPTIPVQFVGGLPTAYQTIFTEGLTTWTVGFNIQIPIKNRSVDAQLAQTQISKQQLLMNRTKTEQNVIVQVRNAVEDLETCRQRVETAQVSRKLAEEELKGETQRFEAGMSQNFLLLQRQADLSAAQGEEVQALITYKKAVITLQQNMYNLLEANDFEIAKSPGKGVAAFE
ncbi:MAG: TolC family protein [Acidobacteriia bacterium]|nr:TolC family protein [Terriglobia bacterium]